MAFSTTDKLVNDNLVSDSARSYDRSVGRKLIYPANKNYVYLNYKETYGIRYEPSGNGNRFSLPQMEAPNETNVDSEIETWQPPDVPPPMTSEVPDTSETISTEANASEITTERIAETEPTESATSQTTSKRPTIPFSALNQKTSNQIKNNGTQMVRPISSIRETLNLIRKRVKQWFTSGIDLNAPLINGQRFLNVFNIIKFENSACTSTQQMLEEMTGTCYHDYQCTEMGGTAIGECADGLGVCCICMLSIFFRFVKNFNAKMVKFKFISMLQ